MEAKIALSPKKIMNKEFKVDFKGYNADEVDLFLDMVIKDYESFAALLNDSYDKIEKYETTILELKRKITQLEKEKAMQEDNVHALEENISTNVDILKRLSLLEKVVFNQNR